MRNNFENKQNNLFQKVELREVFTFNLSQKYEKNLFLKNCLQNKALQKACFVLRRSRPSKILNFRMWPLNLKRCQLLV